MNFFNVHNIILKGIMTAHVETKSNQFENVLSHHKLIKYLLSQEKVIMQECLYSSQAYQVSNIPSK